MPFPAFRHSMSKPRGPPPIIFHPYGPWFRWYAPPMQYESFYLGSAEQETNAFDRLVRPRKDSFYPKSGLNVAKTKE
jgi:hypothetical protein